MGSGGRQRGVWRTYYELQVVLLALVPPVDFALVFFASRGLRRLEGTTAVGVREHLRPARIGEDWISCQRPLFGSAKSHLRR